jgi:5-methylcytosine-specific restriction endonuclease McrA
MKWKNHIFDVRSECPMCGEEWHFDEIKVPSVKKCEQCDYSFTMVYKKIKRKKSKHSWSGSIFDEDGIKPTRPKPPKATPKTTGREPIPQDVIDAVWNRDGGQCVKCNSNQDLEYDHIIPLSKGGSNRYRNLQLLCVKCNRSKSDNIG